MYGVLNVITGMEHFLVSQPTSVSPNYCVLPRWVTQLHKVTGEITVIINEFYYEIIKKGKARIFLVRLQSRCESDRSFLMSTRPSVCPHATAQLSPDGFSRNILFGCYLNLSTYFDVTKNRAELTCLYETCGRHWRSYLRPRRARRKSLRCKRKNSAWSIVNLAVWEMDVLLRCGENLQSVLCKTWKGTFEIQPLPDLRKGCFRGTSRNSNFT